MKHKEHSDSKNLIIIFCVYTVGSAGLNRTPFAIFFKWQP